MSAVRPLAENLAKVRQVVSWNELVKFNLPHRENPIWLAIGRLYQRKWFGRVWTFQEAVLATSHKVICGNMAVDWRGLLQGGD